MFNFFCANDDIRRFDFEEQRNLFALIDEIDDASKNNAPMMSNDLDLASLKNTGVAKTDLCESERERECE